MSSKRYTREVKAKCLELFAGHCLNLEEISKRTGVTKNTLSRWLSEYWFQPTQGQHYKIIKRYD